MIHSTYVLALISAAVAAPAPAGTPAGEFLTAYMPVRAELRATERVVVSAATHAGNRSDRFLGTEFAGLARRTDSAARHLAALHPPTKAGRSRLATLVRSVRHQVSDLRAISSDAQRHDAAAAGRDGRRLGGDLIKVNNGLRRFDQVIGAFRS